MTDTEWVAAFEAGQLPDDGFHHRDHVKMAWLYVTSFGLPQGISRFSSALQHFSQIKGKPGLYHETITWAYLLLIHERVVRQNNRNDWDKFAKANADLLDGSRDILSRYYSKELLDSSLARQVFLFPDRTDGGRREYSTV